MSICATLVVKNCNSLGYPWLEAALCVLPYVEQMVLSEGFSDDDTHEWCRQLQGRYPVKVKIMRTAWPNSTTGFAIGKVTNAALDYARLSRCDWLWNLQADELYHPTVAGAVSSLCADLGEMCEGIELPFLHLQNNYQEVQPGAGYQRAIRVVRNRPHIDAYRDAWTFRGCRAIFPVDERLPVVHANRTYWYNIPLKLRSHADTLYPDLAHYRVSAEESEWKLSEPIPEMFLRSESPFAAKLPDLIKPTIGWLRYEPREGLLA